MNNFAISNVLDPIQEKDAVNLRTLNDKWYVRNATTTPGASSITCNNNNLITIALDSSDVATLSNASGNLDITTASGLDINTTQNITIDN